MEKHWLGIVGDIRVVLNLEENLWWCLPMQAGLGDRIFMYCPRALSPRRQGIFAECELIGNPFSKGDENHRCSKFGAGVGRNLGPLGYTDLKLVKTFAKPLTAKEMKKDRMLKTLPFVRQNFQGTTFSLTKEAADRILQLTVQKLSRRV